jgi:hypothetical protein
MYFDGTDWITQAIGTTGQVLAVNATADGFTYTNALTDTLASTNILVGNGSNIATAVALSGDATIANTGALTISNDAITTVKILNDAITTAKILDANITTAKLADAGCHPRQAR